MTARNQASSNRLACLLLVGLTMLWCVQSSFAEDPPLSLTIRAMATELVVGEPIVLEVTLRNEGEKTVQVQHGLQRFANPDIGYFIENKNLGTHRELFSDTDGGNHAIVSVGPQEEIRHIEWLHIDYFAPLPLRGSHQTIVTASPGTYSVQVQMNPLFAEDESRWPLVSNSVEITVVEAAPEWSGFRSIMALHEFAPWIESGMPRMWGSSRAMLGSYGHGPAFESRNEQLEQIAASGSPYAMYASLLRGGYELSSFHYDGSVEDRIAADEARSKRALKYLELADKEGFPLRSEAVWHMREAAVLLGDDDAVERLTKRLETEFSDTHAAKRPIQSVRYNRGWR